MTKPGAKSYDELTTEIGQNEKKIRQYENREKMLRQKLSRKERRERSHRHISARRITVNINAGGNSNNKDQKKNRKYNNHRYQENPGCMTPVEFIQSLHK